jgi:hypothetical protein
LRIEVGLALEPRFAPAADLWPVLFAGVCDLFERPAAAVEEHPCHTDARRQAALGHKLRAVPGESDVARFFNPAEERLTVRVTPGPFRRAAPPACPSAVHPHKGSGHADPQAGRSRARRELVRPSGVTDASPHILTIGM